MKSTEDSAAPEAPEALAVAAVASERGVNQVHRLRDYGILLGICGYLMIHHI